MENLHHQLSCELDHIVFQLSTFVKCVILDVYNGDILIIKNDVVSITCAKAYLYRDLSSGYGHFEVIFGHQVCLPIEQVGS